MCAYIGDDIRVGPLMGENATKKKKSVSRDAGLGHFWICDVIFYPSERRKWLYRGWLIDRSIRFCWVKSDLYCIFENQWSEFFRPVVESHVSISRVRDRFLSSFTFNEWMFFLIREESFIQIRWLVIHHMMIRLTLFLLHLNMFEHEIQGDDPNLITQTKYRRLSLPHCP